jgi:serine/threonine protein kinase
MRMLAPSLRSLGDDPVAELVLHFEEAWQAGPPPLDRFRARLSPEESSYGLAELVKADLQQRYRRGERPSARDYLERFPDLAGENGHALSLIYEEFCLRAETDDSTSPSEFCDRYPTWRDSLVSQLACHRKLSRAIEPLPSGPDFPEEGDRFGDYELVRILGEGAAARVFLARVSSLGGKEVVVKISRDRGTESEVLGKLDHDNIVAVFATVVDPVTGFRGLCMPYRPGLPLNDILAYFRRGKPPRGAAAFETVVHHAVSDIPLDEGRRHGWADFPTSGVYADGVAWIGLKLAQALAHAHANGIFHRDVKPENVLLSRRDGPQLLDFNLAHDANLGDQARAAHRGGTLPYMAREHLQAFLDPSLWPNVDDRADIFSLGLVLREMLTLKPIDRPLENLNLARTINDLIQKRGALPVPIRQINPRVPHALEAIVAKCLTEAPEDRYALASELAKDLRAYLDRRPLRTAKNLSRVEITHNWVRRRWPGAALALAVVCLSVFALQDGMKSDAVPIARTSAGSIDSLTPQETPAMVVPATAATLAMIENARLEIAGDGRKSMSGLFQKALERPDAEDAFRIASETHPESYSLAMFHGMLSSKGRRFEAAVQSYQRAVTLKPNDFAAWQGLAIAQFEQGKSSEAIESINRAFDLFPNDGSPDANRNYCELRINRSRILFHLGDLARDGKAYSTAREHFLKALADLTALHSLTKPGTNQRIEFSYDYLSTMILTSLGDMDLTQGNRDAAIRSFHSALDHITAARRNGKGREQPLDELQQKVDVRLARLIQ